MFHVERITMFPAAGAVRIALTREELLRVIDALEKKYALDRALLRETQTHRKLIARLRELVNDAHWHSNWYRWDWRADSKARRGSSARTAKPLFSGSNPLRASNLKSFLFIGLLLAIINLRLVIRCAGSARKWRRIDKG